MEEKRISFTEIKVRGYDLDVYKHVNNARYLEYLEAARWDYIEKYVNGNQLKENNWGIAVVRINIRYRRSALFGDLLEVKTYEQERNRIVSIMRQKITRPSDGATIVDAEVSFAVTDLATGKALRIGPDIEAFLDGLA